MGLISSRRLGDVLDFVGVRCEPLPTVRLWPAGPYVLVRFISLTDLVQSFLYLTVAVLTGVASIRLLSVGAGRKSACGRTVSSLVFCFFPERPCVRFRAASEQ